MMLDAKKYAEYLDGRLPAVRYDFNVASEAGTIALGAAFASVIEDPSGASPEQKSKILRIGLCAEMGAGKTTFTEGLKDAIPGKDKVETPPSRQTDTWSQEKVRTQGVWRSPASGWIRHYDARIGRSLGDTSLPSYNNNDTAQYGPVRTDIVEHGAEDDHDTQFQFLIGIFSAVPGDYRRITVMAAPECAKSPGFQKFLKKAQGLNSPERPPSHGISEFLKTMQRFPWKFGR